MEDKPFLRNNLITYKTVAGVLIAIASFFCVGLYNKMDEVQKDIIQIKVHLVEVESKMITRETVREIVQNEIYKYHRTFYSHSDKKKNN